MANAKKNVRQSMVGSSFSIGAKGAVVLLLAAVLAMALCLAGCADSKVQQKTFPLLFQTEENGEAEEGEMNLYFVDGGDIPYVALSEYMPFFGKIYEDESIGTGAVEFNITQSSGTYTVTRVDSGETMEINPKADSIYFLSYDGFMKSPGDTNLVSMVTIGESGLGATGLVMDSGSSYDRQGLVTEFDMSRYGIDLVESGGECYVPLQTMQDMLLSRKYMLTVFNGEKVFVFPYKGTLTDQIYTIEAGEMSEEFAKFNTNELMFLLENFYGLKPEHNIDDIYKFIGDTGLTFEGTDPAKFDSDLRTLLSRYFDDQHSGFLHASCLSSEQDEVAAAEATMATMGTSMTENYFDTILFITERMKYLPGFGARSPDGGIQKVFDYTEIGDTAIITFDSFEVNKKDYYKEADLDNPSDTIELIALAHRQITREGSPIKNVVIDLSCNGGGNGDAAAFLISWVTGSKAIGLRNTLTGAQSVVSYFADVNMDGQFDDSDRLRNLLSMDGIKVYCMTTSNSFSCGNLVPVALKGLYGVTIIGQATGGGSCFVLPCSSASGALFQISGPGQISSIKNGSFYNADTGIDVDVPIRDTETMYDRQKLVDFIHSIQ